MGLSAAVHRLFEFNKRFLYIAAKVAQVLDLFGSQHTEVQGAIIAVEGDIQLAARQQEAGNCRKLTRNGDLRCLSLASVRHYRWPG